MKTKLQFGLAAALLLALTVMFTAGSYSQGTVTFRVNMNVQALLGVFKPGTDSVYVRGNLNPGGGWNNESGAMTLLTDTIYTQTISFPADSGLSYKFFNNDGSAPNTGYENIANNRAWTTTGGNDTLPTVWFNDDSVYTPPPPPPESTQVTFRCNMGVQIAEGNFNPGSGDNLEVRGSFQPGGGWPEGDTLKPLTVGDSIYAGTFTCPQSTQIQFKYYGTSVATGWESINTPAPGDTLVGGNRTYRVGTSASSTPILYFNDISTSNPVASVNVLYQVDLSTFAALNVFQPGAGDSVHLRGTVNGWADAYPDVMTPSLGNPNLYQLATAYSGHVNDILPYKYHINFDTAHAEATWSNWLANIDNYNYEHPYAFGDGNRLLTISQPSGDQPLAPYYFDGLNPKGIIDSGKSVTVTFNVNMGPATRNLAGAFTVGDSVWVRFDDPIWCFMATDSLNTTYKLLLHSVNHDTNYTGSLTVNGPVTYGFLYYYQYSDSGNVEAEGVGEGNQNGYRSRYIQPISANNFPSTYTFPTDSWLSTSPYPEETAPFTPVSGGVEPGAVTVYLHHNASWNMMSIPASPSNDTVASVFPSATSKAFAYSAGYISDNTVAPAAGYWVKFSSAGASSLTGTLSPTMSIPVVAGWNMIGANAYSVPADSADLNPSPDTIISGATFFAYNNGYSATGLLNGGQAYWIKAKHAGTLSATPTKNAPKAARLPINEATSQMNSLTIKDALGHTQVLYLGTKEETTLPIDRFEMPPTPPVGAFDVRYASQRMAEFYSKNASAPSSFVINLSSVAFPITATWSGKSNTNQFTLTDGLNGKAFKPVTLTNGISKKITVSSLPSLTLTVSAITVPKTYSLKQNYPNPFNPTSNISFELPTASRVTLKVYDILGREVATLYDNQTLGAGSFATQFDGRNLASGVYFYRLNANSLEQTNQSFTSVKKMMLIK